jgi:hypothetical protein
MLRKRTEHRMSQEAKRFTSAVVTAYLCSEAHIERNIPGRLPQLGWRNAGP